MKSKNPIGQESGFSYDAFTDGILDSPNNTTASVSCKQRCGSKTPPHANEIDNRDPLTHIYVGDDALERVAEAYFWTPDDFPVAAMALPLNRSAFEFTWPVKNRTVIILPNGDCDDIIYELGHALITCGAAKVIGSINDETVRWKQPIEQRMAA